MCSVFNKENSDKHNLILLLLLRCIAIHFLREFSMTMVMLNKERLVIHLQTFFCADFDTVRSKYFKSGHIYVQCSKEGVYNTCLVTRSI
jgi:hypothetical protein